MMIKKKKEEEKRNTKRMQDKERLRRKSGKTNLISVRKRADMTGNRERPANLAHKICQDEQAKASSEKGLT